MGTTPRQPAIPLTPAQGRIWADQRLRPQSAFYNINRVVHVDGSLDVERFEDALTLVCQAHDSLRFRFGESDGVPFQQATSLSGPGLVHVHDFAGLDDPELAARELLRREQTRPLDLVHDGPLRVHAARTAPGHHVILFQTHHIVSDWWAGGVFFRALSRAYNNGILPRDPEAQYQVYVERQLGRHGGRIHADTRALSMYLGSHVGRLELPYCVDPDVPRRTGASVHLRVSDGDRSRLKQQAGGSSVSEYMFLLAALACVLHRWTGCDDFTVGVYVADRSTPATSEMIGLLFEGLPVRVAFDSTTTFADVLGQVRHGVLTLLSHPTADPEELARDLAGAGPGIAPLFDLTFQMYPARASAPNLGDLRTRGSRLVQETLHDLMTYAHDGPDGLELRLQYDASLFREDAMAAALSAWRRLLSSAAQDTSILVSDFDLRDEIAGSLGSRADGDRRTGGRSGLLADLSRSLLDNGDRTALVASQDATETWTYRRLSAAVELAAGELAVRAPNGETVAILASVSPVMLAAWLGVLRAGAVVLVLDPEEPAERLRYMLRDSGAALVICDPDCPALTFVPPDLPRLFLDDLIGPPAEERCAAPVDGSQTDPVEDEMAPAALIYTSGSTGRPKGVVLSRFGLLNQAEHRIDLLGLRGGSHMGVSLPQHFVTFPLQALSGLLSGSAITLFSRSLLQDPVELMTSANEAGLEVMELSVAGLDAFLFAIEQRIEHAPYEHLRVVLVAGEKLRPRLARRFRERFPQVDLVNAYGMTETCGMVASTVIRELGSYSEGRPTRNCVLEVVDHHGRVIPQGWVGELRVSGKQVSLGYWRKPGLTAERFTSGPDGRSVLTGDLARMGLDGTIEIIGRMDDQLSLRGFRIEPAEVCRVVEAHPAVRRCEVVLWPVADSDGYLVAYVLADQGIPQTELRDHCLAHLPPVMVPRQFVRIDEYPRGRTGKLERQRLPKPSVLLVEARPPSTPLEMALAAIWREVLGTDSVSLDSDFFEIGGQSLAAVRVVARIDAKLHVRLSANAVFEYPTLESLTQHVAAHATRQFE